MHIYMYYTHGLLYCLPLMVSPVDPQPETDVARGNGPLVDRGR